MPSLILTCPHCGFSRELPAVKVPERPLRVTCPKCRESFDYRKPAAAAPPPAEESQPPSVAPPAAAAEPSPPRPAPGSPGRLRGIGGLFKDSWEIYLRRVGVLMGLYLLSILLMLVPVGVFAMIGGAASLAIPGIRIPLLVAGILTGLVLGSIALFWGLAALVFAVADQNLGIKAALQKGSTRIWAFLWVFALTGFIVTGGFMLFFVPGVIFSVWFFLTQFVLAAEDERGMRALLKSRAYIQGRFIEVFLRLLLVWIVSVALGMIPILGGILSLLFVPFMMIYSWLIYDDLRPKAGHVSFSCTTADKTTWLVIGALGYVIPLIFLMLAVVWLGISLSSLTLPWRGIGNFGF